MQEQNKVEVMSEEDKDNYIADVVNVIKKSCVVLIDFGYRKLFESNKEEADD